MGLFGKKKTNLQGVREVFGAIAGRNVEDLLKALREGKVQIELSGNEALVLSAFLHRFSDTAELRIEDQAEERVLWDMTCILENKLAAVDFSADYAKLLSEARASVRDYEPGPLG
jgi:hypothetical protein